jgi:hypothetical protein
MILNNLFPALIPHHYTRLKFTANKFFRSGGAISNRQGKSGGAAFSRIRNASIIPADLPPIFPYPIRRLRISFLYFNAM